jgi:hypothetical protein
VLDKSWTRVDVVGKILEGRGSCSRFGLVLLVLCFDFVLSIPRYPCREVYHTCTYTGGISFVIKERLGLASEIGYSDVFRRVLELCFDRQVLWMCTAIKLRSMRIERTEYY